MFWIFSLKNFVTILHSNRNDRRWKQRDLVSHNQIAIFFCISLFCESHWPCYSEISNIFLEVKVNQVFWSITWFRCGDAENRIRVQFLWRANISDKSHKRDHNNWISVFFWLLIQNLSRYKEKYTKFCNSLVVQSIKLQDWEKMIICAGITETIFSQKNHSFLRSSLTNITQLSFNLLFQLQKKNPKIPK